MSNSAEQQAVISLVKAGREFWASSRGSAVQQAERACLGPVSDRWFGNHGLELGLGAGLADTCQIRHLMYWVPCPDLADTDTSLVCHPDALPLPDGELDLVLIHHLLEMASEPYRLLQEAARVTADDGHLVIFGWSPLSPSALTGLVGKRRHEPCLQGQWRTPSQLAEWLAFVDFDVQRVDYCGFRLPGRPLANARLEVFGRRHNLPLGESFMIHARPRSLLATTNRKRRIFGKPMVGHAVNGATRLGKQPQHKTRDE